MARPIAGARAPFRLFAVASALSLLVVAAGPAGAHDSPEYQIEVLTKKIAASPGDASLYLERAELQRVRRSWAEGIADLQAASRLDPGMPAVDYSLADLLLRADNPRPALASIDRFLAKRPEHVAGQLLRARILLKLDRALEAARAFDRGIELAHASGAERIQPDEYLDRARALASLGGRHVDEALRGLDEGIASLGAPVTLQLLAVEIELERGGYDAALERLAAVEARAKRKESWMARRAEVLAKAGRGDEAAKLRGDALLHITALPPHLRGLPSTAELEAKLRRDSAEDAR